MYTGKVKPDDSTKVPDVVRALLEPFAGRISLVCCDRGYTGKEVIDYVTSIGSKFIGTALSNRFSSAATVVPEGEHKYVQFTTPNNNKVDVLEVHPVGKS